VEFGIVAAFVGFFVIALVLVVVGVIQAKKRREAMAGFAASRGWRFAASDDSLVNRFQGTPFGDGSGRRATNVVYGEHDGRAMVAFDYEYTTTSGTGENRQRTTHHWSVLAVSMGVLMPDLSVEPEGMLGRMIGRLTNTDIEMESEDFNRAFTVRSPSRKFAFDVLHPQMIEMLMRWPELGWRFEGDSMLVVRNGRHSIQEVDAKLTVMDAILDKIPEFVWKDVGRP
jgi:hypothetical protein